MKTSASDGAPQYHLFYCCYALGRTGVELREQSSGVTARLQLLRKMALALVMLCAACSVPATINTKPFDQFSNAARQLDLGADQAFANGVTFTEAGFVEQVAADPKYQISW